MCSDTVKERLYNIIDGMGLPTDYDIDKTALFDFILRDKKASGNQITITFVNEIGKAELIKMPIEKIKDYLS